MPYYGYKGRLAYFAYAKHHIGLYAMPPIVKDHAKELKRYKTATATIRFPLNEKMPIALIKKLVRVGVRNNETKSKKNEEKGKLKICSRGHNYQGKGPCPLCWPGYKKR